MQHHLRGDVTLQSKPQKLRVEFLHGGIQSVAQFLCLWRCACLEQCLMTGCTIREGQQGSSQLIGGTDNGYLHFWDRCCSMHALPLLRLAKKACAGLEKWPQVSELGGALDGSGRLMRLITSFIPDEKQHATAQGYTSAWQHEFGAWW